MIENINLCEDVVNIYEQMRAWIGATVRKSFSPSMQQNKDTTKHRLRYNQPQASKV